MPCSQIFLHLLKNVKILLGFFKSLKFGSGNYGIKLANLLKQFLILTVSGLLDSDHQNSLLTFIVFWAGIQSTLNTDGQAVHDFGNLPVRCSLASQLTLTYFDARK